MVPDLGEVPQRPRGLRCGVDGLGGSGVLMVPATVVRFVATVSSPWLARGVNVLATGSIVPFAVAGHVREASPRGLVDEENVDVVVIRERF